MTNIAIQHSKSEAKPQILAACKAAGAKGYMKNGDLIVTNATRALVDTILGIDGAHIYAPKQRKNGTFAIREVESADDLFGPDVVAEFLASKAEEYAQLEAKADAALDAVDAMLGAYSQEEVAEVVEAEPILSHYEVEFSGKEFAKCLREVKKVEGRKFDATLKVWTIPASTTQATRDWLVHYFCTVTPVYKK